MICLQQTQTYSSAIQYCPPTVSNDFYIKEYVISGLCTLSNEELGCTHVSIHNNEYIIQDSFGYDVFFYCEKCHKLIHLGYFEDCKVAHYAFELGKNYSLLDSLCVQNDIEKKRLNNALC
tara:strand:+ start:300 stop:659 length:360 start_codon:yes stop_codon:yes gene_type:complete